MNNHIDKTKCAYVSSGSRIK